MATKLSSPLLSKFKGCLMGAVVGDCMGEPLERVWSPKPISRVLDKIKQFETKVAEGETGFARYTDDSCMTFDLGGSLLKKKGFHPKNVAKNFSETYHASSSQRNYGGNVPDIFEDWKEAEYKGDIWKPASQVFNGSGSYGNGSAMRVSPAALFAHGDTTKIVDLASKQSKLTHTNPLGVIGAVLQALAIEKALTSETIDDPGKFFSELLESVKERDFEVDKMELYEEKIGECLKMLSLESENVAKAIDAKVGSGVTAQQAVPTSIFCFLYTLDETKIEELKEFNGFARAIIFSVAVSRDCDTVGSMVGAIAGAYYGVEMIPPDWVKACEGNDKALRMAEDLFHRNQKKNKNK